MAAGFIGRGEDARRSAADLCAQAVGDSRFDTPELGRNLTWLSRSGVGTLTRLAAPLRDIGPVSVLHAAEMTLTVEALVAALATTPPHLHFVLG